MPPKPRPVPEKGKGSGKGKAASGQGEHIPTSCTYGKHKFTADAKKWAAQAVEDAEKKKSDIPVYSVHETDFFLASAIRKRTAALLEKEVTEDMDEGEGENENEDEDLLPPRKKSRASKPCR